jgi:hypothetical protein
MLIDIIIKYKILKKKCKNPNNKLTANRVKQVKEVKELWVVAKLRLRR